MEFGDDGECLRAAAEQPARAFACMSKQQPLDVNGITMKSFVNGYAMTNPHQRRKGNRGDGACAIIAPIVNTDGGEAPKNCAQQSAPSFSRFAPSAPNRLRRLRERRPLGDIGKQDTCKPTEISLKGG